VLFFFFIHSVTKSALQCAANTSSSFAFLQVVLVDGIPLSSCRPTVYKYLFGIFLDDTSTREQFAFLVYCYRVKAIFHNLDLCTVLYWRLCSLTNSPIVKYPLSWGMMSMERRRFSQTMASEWQIAFLSLTKCHAVPCSLPSRITTKVLKNARLFLQDRDQNQMFKTKTKISWSKTKIKTFIFVLEAPRDQDPDLEDYITGCSSSECTGCVASNDSLVASAFVSLDESILDFLLGCLRNDLPWGVFTLIRFSIDSSAPFQPLQ